MSDKTKNTQKNTTELFERIELLCVFSFALCFDEFFESLEMAGNLNLSTNFKVRESIDIDRNRCPQLNYFQLLPQRLYIKTIKTHLQYNGSFIIHFAYHRIILHKLPQ